MADSYSISEQEFLDRLFQKEGAALQMLFETYFPVLCHFAGGFLPDESLAKDIVQETFIKLWHSNRRFDTLAGLKSFLFTVTKNACLNWIRDNKRLEDRHRNAHGLVPDEEDETFNNIVLAESIALIYNEVRTMSPKMQEIFFLSYEHGLSVSEIAAQLNMNVKAVKKQKYKSLAALRTKFSQNPKLLVLLLPLIIK